jgi:GxxExxY protein
MSEQRPTIKTKALIGDIPENAITERIIKCAIEVHRQLGPGLLEGVYEEALAIECELDGLRVARQVIIPIDYKGRTIGEYRIDLLIENMVIVEVKSVERYDPVFEAQILTYLKVTGKKSWSINQLQLPACKRRYSAVYSLTV